MASIVAVLMLCCLVSKAQKHPCFLKAQLACWIRSCLLAGSARTAQAAVKIKLDLFFCDEVIRV
jgi:hypothetical protein